MEEVDNRHKAVYVKGSRGKVDTLWLGAGGDVHTRIMAKIREVLGATALYPYLAPSAAARLERARRLAKESGLLTRSVLLLQAAIPCSSCRGRESKQFGLWNGC